MKGGHLEGNTTQSSRNGSKQRTAPQGQRGTHRSRERAEAGSEGQKTLEGVGAGGVASCTRWEVSGWTLRARGPWQPVH